MQSVPNVGHFLNDNIDNFSFPPLPLPPPLLFQPIRQFYQPKTPSLPPQILTFKRENDAGANTTKTLSGDFLKGELEKIIEKENLEPGEDIIFTSAKLPRILDNKDFKKKTKKKKKKKTRCEIKDEIDLNKSKEEIDAVEIPKEIEFYFGRPNQNFFIMC